uniref:nucleoside-diphosphate kinase n=1 Tax=Glossina morsitans morsitans TaxID=37546 RepID=A0A1B0GA32_GLOMM
MIKPERVERKRLGEITECFKQKGFKLLAMKFMWASEELLKKCYKDMTLRLFFPGLVSYILERTQTMPSVVWMFACPCKNDR